MRARPLPRQNPVNENRIAIYLASRKPLCPRMTSHTHWATRHVKHVPRVGEYLQFIGHPRDFCPTSGYMTVLVQEVRTFIDKDDRETIGVYGIPAAMKPPPPNQDFDFKSQPD